MNEALSGLIIRFSRAASTYSLKFALCTGLRQTQEYQEGIKESIRIADCQLCLRLFKHDFRQVGLESSIKTLLAKLGRRISDVHLIVDFQAIGEDPPEISTWLERLPMCDEWLSFTVVSGAFPRNLAELAKNQQHFISRIDLSCWREYAGEATGRIAAYGDYGIQHGIFEENEGKQFNFSASLRYACANECEMKTGPVMPNG